MEGNPEPIKRRIQDHHRGREQSRNRKRILARIKRYLDGDLEKEESRSYTLQGFDQDSSK